MMNKIILTGDTHADISRILFINDSEMTKDDIVIILGDFGVIWKENDSMTQEVLQMLGEKKFTTAFLDGNHENFIEIARLEKKAFWNGGKVGILPYGIIHLLRGEIYNIEGRIIGVCGGANSIDLWHRKEGISWWREEEITDNDINNFIAAAGKYNNKIDIVLSHDAPASIIPIVKLYSGVNDGNISNSQKQLEKINQLVKFKKWYFGHWHIDKAITNEFECLYRGIKNVEI